MVSANDFILSKKLQNGPTSKSGVLDKAKEIWHFVHKDSYSTNVIQDMNELQKEENYFCSLLNLLKEIE